MPQGTGSKKAEKYYTATFTSPGYTGVDYGNDVSVTGVAVIYLSDNTEVNITSFLIDGE